MTLSKLWETVWAISWVATMLAIVAFMVVLLINANRQGF